MNTYQSRGNIQTCRSSNPVDERGEARVNIRLGVGEGVTDDGRGVGLSERLTPIVEHQYNTVAESSNHDEGEWGRGGEGEIWDWTYASCSSTAETASLVFVLMLAAHGRDGVQCIYMDSIFLCSAVLPTPAGTITEPRTHLDGLGRLRSSGLSRLFGVGFHVCWSVWLKSNWLKRVERLTRIRRDVSGREETDWELVDFILFRPRCYVGLLRALLLITWRERRGGMTSFLKLFLEHVSLATCRAQIIGLLAGNLLHSPRTSEARQTFLIL